MSQIVISSDSSYELVTYWYG